MAARDTGLKKLNRPSPTTAPRKRTDLGQGGATNLKKEGTGTTTGQGQRGINRLQRLRKLCVKASRTKAK